MPQISFMVDGRKRETDKGQLGLFKKGNYVLKLLLSHFTSP